jgi:ATP-dependent Clp protease adapter protein ClpS
MHKVKSLPLWDLVLYNDDEVQYSEITKALKIIFGLTISECGFIAMEAHTKGKVVIETIHNEKLSLRKEQIQRFNVDSGIELPIKYEKKNERT